MAKNPTIKDGDLRWEQGKWWRWQAWIGNLWGMIVNGVEVVNVRVILGIRKNIIICPT
jgi:hypothetical protein